MKRRNFLLSPLAAKSVPALARQAGGATGGFRAGFAEADITPEIGMEQPGGYGKAYHKSFHDPCKVRVAVFEDGARAVALISLDALTAPQYLVDEARRRLAAECGLPGEAVLIGATHSHSSGPIGMIRRGDYDHASPLVQKLAYEHSTVDNPRYVQRVLDQMVAAVSQARKTAAPVRAAAGFGYESQVAFNRRLRMKNGLSWSHPGQGNPDIIAYAGPVDPQVGVVGAWDQSGGLAGCIVNYACHATTSPGGISANWIYYLEQMIRGAFGRQVVVLFFPGACGDITQVDNLSPYARPTGEQSARLVGGRVGAEAVKVLLSATPGELTPVEYRRKVLKIARRKPAPEKVKRAYALVEQDPKQVGETEWTFAKETVLLDALLKVSSEVDVEVQAIQLGPAIFLTNPAELFCQLGLEIKARSRFPFTFPVELANGCVGYVPTEEAFGPNGGGYETRLTSYSNLEISAGRRIVEAAVELADRLTPGGVPEPPKAPPFKAPWSYGNVPPEIS
jgi:hypothetical protein